MARPRSAAKKDDETYYAWSDLYNGGEIDIHKSANGVERRIIKSRNITPRGEEVSQSSLGCEDDEWQALIDGGSVRPYPVPEGADANVSPHRAVLASIVDENGDIDVNKLLSLGATSVASMATLPAPMNPPADSEDIRTLNDDDNGPSGA